ncbi:CGNR zinc finger domain-containing protein [Nonomuraea sp. NPDC050663]|uniref:CGNR zinc finger domain-containing protein n=1 Tax=Nonomuraea sp. NPDC050663 TaxID=3364370 RepID=UPI0037BCDFF0
MAESVAPGGLEQVRAFINTWWVPNDTRVPEDRLPGLVADPAAWRAELPAVPTPGVGGSSDGELAELRRDLRVVLGQEQPIGLSPWLVRHPLRADLSSDAPGVVLRPQTDGTAGRLLALVVEAVRAGQWARLKACPDCSWVFYDHSRNGARRWCAMNPAPGARGCGSIAKVRAYRDRLRE